MARKYDASRRSALAQRTREAILEAAFTLHGQGILDTESLAKAADVSVATIRKHFPTRELLFEGCTAFGMHLVPTPDLEAIGRVEDPADPLQSIEGGTRWLRRLATQFDGDMVLAVAAYHAGPDAVLQSGGLPPLPGTRRYVKRVMAAYWELRAQGPAG